MARRKRKRRARRAPLLLLLAIALVIAGFVARRVLVPRALHYLRYRASGRDSGATRPERAPDAETSTPLKPGGARASAAPHIGTAVRAESAPALEPSGPPSERITRSDRRALDAVLRDKSK